jgi:hypothetical protein
VRIREAVDPLLAKHGGEYPTEEDAEALSMFAPEAFWLRHATVLYAGAEAVRRAGYEDWQAGADDDEHNTVDAINRITADDESIDCLYKLAKRRAVVLVEYYWPEIEAVASALLKSKTLSGEEVERIVHELLDARNGVL